MIRGIRVNVRCHADMAPIIADYDLAHSQIVISINQLPMDDDRAMPANLRGATPCLNVLPSPVGSGSVAGNISNVRPTTMVF